MKLWTDEMIKDRTYASVPVGDYLFLEGDFYIRRDRLVDGKHWDRITDPVLIEGLKELMKPPPDLDYVRRSLGLPEGTEL